MNYKELFNRVLLLISSPAKAWEEILLEEDKQKVFVGFVYPMIGIAALSVFLGVLFTQGWSGPRSFQIAMTECCSVAISLFGGFYLAAYLLNKATIKFFNLSDNLLRTQRLIGYSSVVLFILQIVTGILPNFQIVSWLLQFYVVYIVWEGAKIFVKMEENDRLKYTLLTSFLLLACPFIIEFLFTKLVLILN
ncbi:MAG: YIP1 family protein [Bacteroidales bacterium]|nr:YIP1 family protein [Bacteroidales bacterium]